MSSANTEGHRAVRALTAGVSAAASQKLVTQTEVNAVIGRYVSENMFLLSTADSDLLRKKSKFLDIFKHIKLTYAIVSFPGN